MQNIQDIGITSHDPRVQKAIPMHRIFGAQLVIERVRIGQNLRFQQANKTEAGVGRCHD